MVMGSSEALIFRASELPIPMEPALVGCTFGVTRLQLSGHLRQGQALGLEQQRGVIHQISGLADDRLVILRNGRQGELDAFFADFLSDAGQSFFDQFCGVAAGRRVGDALGNDLFQPAEKL